MIKPYDPNETIEDYLEEGKVKKRALHIVLLIIFVGFLTFVSAVAISADDAAFHDSDCGPEAVWRQPLSTINDNAFDPGLCFSALGDEDRRYVTEWLRLEIIAQRKRLQLAVERINSMTEAQYGPCISVLREAIENATAADDMERLHTYYEAALMRSAECY